MQMSVDIENATLEAIYWWNRTEGYYHNYFSKLDQLYSEKQVFDFFVSKIFQVFLGEYSIRRNIASGESNVREFVVELIDLRFVEEVKAGNTAIIDKLSNYFKESVSTTNNRQVRSLLSKIAFLVNPSDFSLLDSYAKYSLWSLAKDAKQFKKHELETYSDFIKQVNDYIASNGDLFSGINDILLKFNATDAFSLFNKSPVAFKRRVFDKYLWIKQAKQNGRSIDNKGYEKFITY